MSFLIFTFFLGDLKFRCVSFVFFVFPLKSKGMSIYTYSNIQIRYLTIRFQIVVPALPGKSLKRQLPFRSDDGIFEEEFIENRRKQLEQFINKYVD